MQINFVKQFRIKGTLTVERKGIAVKFFSCKIELIEKLDLLNSSKCTHFDCCNKKSAGIYFAPLK